MNNMIENNHHAIRSHLTIEIYTNANTAGQNSKQEKMLIKIDHIPPVTQFLSNSNIFQKDCF